MERQYEVLYCVGCHSHTLTVRRKAASSAVAKCPACSTESTVGGVRRGMLSHGIRPKSLDSVRGRKEREGRRSG
jgi:hypothetical protein